MKLSELKKIFTVKGIGAASGILFLDETIYLVSDNGANLYCCNLDGTVLSRIKISDTNVVQNIPKIIKPDYEALTYDGEFIYAIGSGSTANRCNIAIVNRTNNQLERYFDATNLYGEFQNASKLSADQLNLEGVIKTSHGWLFFQRGNGSENANGIFAVSDIFDESPAISYEPVELNFEKKLAIGFTDAISDDNHIYFLATAEDTNSTYLDGEVLGTWIGIMDAQTLTVLDYKLISKSKKFEGIAIFKNEAMKITFLLCEDNDSDDLFSDVWEIVWEK